MTNEEGPAMQVAMQCKMQWRAMQVDMPVTCGKMRAMQDAVTRVAKIAKVTKVAKVKVVGQKVERVVRRFTW
jgi:uncharacterized Fe-S cluster-containing radical SAM superfamily protein